MTETVADLDFSERFAVDGYGGIAFRCIGYVMRDPECQGHPDDGDFNGPAGETFYCDGTCEESWEDETMVRAVMVGDDRVFEVDVDDLTVLRDDEYCNVCGQIGCGHGSNNR
jgi:hypothetical protein